jgi:diguanylate cyclase (GGDEF)-like protein
MGTGRGKSVRNLVHAVRGWPLFALPAWLVGYIIAVVAADIAAVLVASQVGFGGGRDAALFGALVACNAVTVELTRRIGETAGIIKDVHGVWELPVAILLPPVYAILMPILRVTLGQWRIRQIGLHRRVFNAAILGLSYASASLVFHAVTGTSLSVVVGPSGHPELWLAAVVAAGAVQWTMNTVLVFPPIKGTDPSVSLAKLVAGRETILNDATELCVAALVACGIVISPLTIFFSLPFATLLQRSFRHVQLVNASRLDSKTGLLNAGTWEREAAAEVARAVRTHSPLAVALIDVDHFKSVNDLHGHLVGDRALKAISRTLTVFLREYDLVGRFGGEEFALLLPQTRAVDAYRIAERIRAYIAAMPIDTGDDFSGDSVTVTVSIGVAALGSRWDTGSASQLTDLIAAADAALYRAKGGGRDQVCVVTERATFVGEAEVDNGQGQAPSSPPADVPPSDDSKLSSPEPAGSQA